MSIAVYCQSTKIPSRIVKGMNVGSAARYEVNAKP